MQEIPVLGYRKLIVYQKSKELVLAIYKLTANYPKSETFSLVAQMRRAAISVAANLIEGYSKESSSEYSRFLTISIGSLAELEFFVEISFDFRYIAQNDSQKINSLIYEVKKLLYGSRKAARLRRSNKL